MGSSISAEIPQLVQEPTSQVSPSIEAIPELIKAVPELIEETVTEECPCPDDTKSPDATDTANTPAKISYENPTSLSLDFNSLYPSIMIASNALPIPKTENQEPFDLSSALKRFLELSRPTNGKDEKHQLFVISSDHILGYVTSLEAAKLWIDEEVSQKTKLCLSGFEIHRKESLSEDNMIYSVTVYEKDVNSLTRRSVIFLQYNLWQISRLYLESSK